MNIDESLKTNEHQWLVNAWIVRIIRLGILTLGWSAIIIIITLGWDGLHTLFSTYTIQSNLLVLIWLSIATIFQEKYKAHWFFNGIIHGAITLYITVTFIIFAILLAPLYHPTGIGAYTNLIVHYLVPIAFITDTVLTEIKHEYSWKYIIFWLVYPIFYLILTLIRGYITGDYIYPFLDLNSMGIGLFVLWCFILSAVFLLLGSLLVFLNKKIGKRLK